MHYSSALISFSTTNMNMSRAARLSGLRDFLFRSPHFDRVWIRHSKFPERKLNHFNTRSAEQDKQETKQSDTIQSLWTLPKSIVYFPPKLRQVHTQRRNLVWFFSSAYTLVLADHYNLGTFLSRFAALFFCSKSRIFQSDHNHVMWSFFFISTLPIPKFPKMPMLALFRFNIFCFRLRSLRCVLDF